MQKFENDATQENEFQSLDVNSSKEEVSELVEIPAKNKLQQENETVSENRKLALLKKLKSHKSRDAVLLVLFFFIYVVSMCLLPIMGNFAFRGIQFIGAFTLSVTTIALLGHHQKSKIKQELIAITKKEGNREDSHLISSLINLLTPEDVKSSVNQEVMELLTKHLPEMKASDATLLTQAQKDRLTRELKLSTSDRSKSDLLEVLFPNETRIRYRIAILKAFEQIGGMKELAEVKRLATEKPMNRKAIEVQDAARECLPYLQERAEGEQAKNLLLRASSVPTNDAELLRPHVGKADSRDAKELLRPS